MNEKDPHSSFERATSTRSPEDRGALQAGSECVDDARPGSEMMLRLLAPRKRSGSADLDVDAEREKPAASGGAHTYLDEDPAEVAAALLIGRALAGIPGVFERIRDGSPVLILDCPNETWIEPAADALMRCFGSRPGDTRNEQSGERPGAVSGAIIVKAKSRQAGIAITERDGQAARAFRLCRPLIGVAAPGRTQLPAELSRACDERIALGPLRPLDLTLVTTRIVGSAPATIIPGEIAAHVEPVDLRIAVHPARGADGSIERLRKIVERGISKPQNNSAPRLSELRGYGAAGEWGIAAAADLASYEKNMILWSDCDPGALLTGPPGTGKTLFAAALAREAGTAFLAGSLAQWQAEGEAHLGTTLKAMRGFFRRAHEMAPCVALVDELDSFGDRRSLADHNRHYSIQVVNGFLECLDGDGSRAGVLLIGTTNDAGRIDPAILRSGRFDRVIAIELPSLDDLAGILRHHLGADLPDADLTEIARRGLGGTGADCAAWVRRARGRARRAGRTVLEADLLLEIASAIGESCAEEQKRAAFHEAGHAIAARALGLKHGDLVLSSPAYGGDGYMRCGLPRIMTSRTLRDVLVMLLAGRAAEILEFGLPSNGAEADLSVATSLARAMHRRWGLMDRLAVGETLDGSEPGARIERILRKAARAALELLSVRRDRLDRVARALLARRSLTEAELERLLGGNGEGAARNEKPCSGS